MKELIVLRSGLKEIVDKFLINYFILNENGIKEVSQGAIDSLKAAQDRMNELVSMSKEDIECVVSNFNSKLNVDDDITGLDDKHIDCLISTIPRRTLINSSKDIDTEIDDFLMNLTDELGCYKSYEHMIIKKTPAKWYEEEVKASSNHLQRKIIAFQEELENVKIINDSVNEIKKLFKDIY